MTPLPCNFSFPSGRSTASVRRWSAEPVSWLPQALSPALHAGPGSAIFLRDWLNFVCPDATCRRMASHPERSDCMPQMDTLIKQLPKCELHIHIEGSLEPELMFALARRNGIASALSVGRGAARAYRFGNLQDFLDLYYQGMSVLITEQDFYDLALAYLERAHADNVRHVEMFFDPQGHTSRGIAFATVIEGLHRAIVDAGAKLGVQASLIMCFLRHLDEADAEQTLDSALRIQGLDRRAWGSIHPRPAIRRANSSTCSAAPAMRASFSVAHAGEEGPPSYVWEALDVLGVARHRSRQSFVGG